MKKIVLAIDSYKGCLSSREAEEAAAQGIRRIFPFCETVCLPVADGGEGMLDALVSATEGRYIPIRAHNPIMEIIDTRYGIAADEKTAFIEMAAVSGLPLLPPEKRNPLLTTSYGTGELIRDALEKGCTRFIIGLGGSATNDAGMGMLQALGFRFFSKNKMELGLDTAINGKMMKNIDFIDTSSALPSLFSAHFTGACDVHNPFFGSNGAAYVFAPQKGATPAMTEELDNGLRHLSMTILKCTGKSISHLPGSGAAGGMGGGMMAFLNSELKSGFGLIAEMLNFEEQIKDADFIFTGEGKSDRQTLMGKTAYGILAKARRQQIPIILLSGSIEDTEELNQAGFHAVFSTTPFPISLEQAMNRENACTNIRRTAEQICRIINIRQ